MIELEVNESPDSEVIGKHQFFFPKISVGKMPECQLFIEDADLSQQEVYLESNSNHLFIKSSLSDFYHINGKKISGKKLIRPNDQFKIAQTTITLLQYDPHTIHHPFTLNQLQNPFAESFETGEQLIESIENELIFIEYHCKK